MNPPWTHWRPNKSECNDMGGYGDNGVDLGLDKSYNSSVTRRLNRDSRNSSRQLPRGLGHRGGERMEIMKRAAALVLVILAAFTITISCSSDPGGGGGGLFDMGGEKTYFDWDMLFLVMGDTCPKGFAGSGSGLSLEVLPGASLPIQGLGLYPGVRGKTDGTQWEATIPEVKTLHFSILGEAGVVSEGDQVKVHFIYKAAADAENGDYFLARISDGDRFLYAAKLRGGAMDANVASEADYSYTAQADGFGLQFIIGLSGPADVFYLDELEIYVNDVLVWADYFEAGDYTQPQFLPDAGNPVFVRVAALPYHQLGEFGLSADDVLEGANSLKVTGGRYFTMYGQGGEFDGFAGVILNFHDPDPLDPYIGESMAMKQSSSYIGTYKGYDDVPADCAEEGSLMIAEDPSGNADISGVWTIQISGYCDAGGGTQEEFLMQYSDLDGTYALGDPVSVAKFHTLFLGYPFADPYGNAFSSPIGLTMGESGVLILSWEYMTNPMMAQFAGVYDKSSGVIQGQVLGALPKADGSPCVLIEGQSMFQATIDKSHDVPPPGAAP